MADWREPAFKSLRQDLQDLREKLDERRAEVYRLEEENANLVDENARLARLQSLAAENDRLRDQIALLTSPWRKT